MPAVWRQRSGAAASKVQSHGDRRPGWFQTAFHAILFIGLLGSNVGQRVAFKDLGYVLGPYPFFVLICISFAFIPIFALICVGIIATFGGWLPESRTWRCMGSFAVIGCCNALQGAGMVFANPHVAGYLQALLQQAIIPFTLVASMIILRARFSLRQYAGVLLIVAGIGLQLLPDAFSQGASKPFSAVDGPSNELGAAGTVWPLVFLFAQLPVALAAIFQEQAFQATPVNVFHMMFWASTSQFLTLLVLAPLDMIPEVGDASSPAAFAQNFAEAWHCVVEGRAAWSLFACVATMLLAQLLQALMVKHSSAAFCVLCMAFVVPTSAVAFTLPSIAGAHTERLAASTPTALALVFVGVMCYRLGAQVHAEPVTANPTPVGATPLLDEHRLPLTSPKICAAGVGIIQSEYTNSKGGDLSIFIERTLSDPAA